MGYFRIRNFHRTHDKLNFKGSTVYWESFTEEENIREFHGFRNDRKYFLATIFYLLLS